MGYGVDTQSMLQQLEDLLGISLIASVAGQVPAILIQVAVYALTAVALSTLAKRRGCGKAWMAWVPLANTWLLGSVSDHYRAVAKAETKHRRKLLLITEIAISVIAIVMLVLVFVMLFQLLTFGLGNPGGLEDLTNVNQAMAKELLGTIAGPLVGIVLLSLVLLPVVIIHVVYRFVALHDIYKSCDPDNATLYLVLGILLSYAQPIILFVCRNRDDGLPFRATPQPTSPCEQ